MSNRRKDGKPARKSRGGTPAGRPPAESMGLKPPTSWQELVEPPIGQNKTSAQQLTPDGGRFRPTLTSVRPAPRRR